MKFIWRVVLTLFFATAALLADTKAQPAPTFENPRKAVFQISDGSDKMLNAAINNINNLLKAYEPGKITIGVIAWGDGIRLLAAKNNKYASRVKALQEVDVEFVACMNTMEHKHLKKSDMLEGVTFVQAGLQEIIERDMSGWMYIKP